MRSSRYSGSALCVAILFALAALAVARVPQKINYQGRVTHISSGIPLPGAHEMTFRIYDMEAGGTELWTETQTVEADADGVVSTLLGDVNPITLTFGIPYWLQVEVDGEIVSPRRELVSSGYCFNSERLDGLDASDFASDDHAHHSLDAEDGSPHNALYVNQDGDVGIGLTGPEARLHVVTGNSSAGIFINHGNITVPTVRSRNDVGVAGVFESTGGTPAIQIGEQAAIYGVSTSQFYTAAFLQQHPAGWGGLYAETWGAGYSGYFKGGQGIYVEGDINATGDVNKSGGSFKIDHPLDPANKYLYHSFVESPDRKNVYDGVVTLDARGRAWIDLPDWFSVLNRDFRYQLTAIGGAAPDLHVASEVDDNRFAIAGGQPGMKVSWQITGIRQDPYAIANPLQVEVEKTGDERGRYVHPELYGMPESKRIPHRSLSEQPVDIE